MARARALLLVAALALGLLQQCSTLGESEEKLIGWKGDSYKPNDYVYSNRGDPQATGERRPWIQQISWRPRAFIYHNFLTEEEATHIVKVAAPKMKRSTVVGSKNDSVVDEYRTSYGTFLTRRLDPILAAMENRLALFTHLPVVHQEDLQVLRYGVSNQYRPHMDGLGRVATILFYLNEVDEGGETAFPDGSQWAHPDMARMAGNLSACAAGHVAHKPKRGDALLFYDRMPDYLREDPRSTHTGCPVIRGVKWNAVKWVHGTPFRPETFKDEVAAMNTFKEQYDPGECKDYHKMCATWATAGECEKNPGYMKGEGDGDGQCRLACNACETCGEGDAECVARNRKRAGYLVYDPSEFSKYVKVDPSVA